MKGVDFMFSKVRAQESGAVSLFVVIFAMLLITVVTVSFLRIMVDDQSRATNNDLAQSALDSAYAGVEDAKRALVWYMGCETSSEPGCANAKDAIISTKCNEAIRLSGVVKSGAEGDGEIKVQQAVAVEGVNPDAALDQAYTCVKIELDSDDYLANIPANQSILIPLVGTEPFSRVQLQWFSRDDMTNPNAAVNVPTEANANKGLLKQGDWPSNRPAVMRTQFIQTGNNFTLGDFDYYKYESGGDARQSNVNTLFFYPMTNGPALTGMAGDARATSQGERAPTDADIAPRAVRCETNIAAAADGYSCKVGLNLPLPMEGSHASAQNRYLRLTSLYAGSHVRITLIADAGVNTPAGGGREVKFQAVQPVVDATGRASNIFRRVQSRIELYDTLTFPYPDAAVDVSKSFCKDFGVTNDAYLGGSCSP